jgi:hypothetical protein
MATFTPGYTFLAGEQLTPTKLNTLISSAVFTNLTASNFAGSLIQVLIYGNAAPPYALGRLWYDTTSGAEGLKMCFQTPSASYSAWLYMTPRREGLFFTNTGVSIGEPLFLQGPPRTTATCAWYQFDGCLFPIVGPQANASGAHPFFVHAMETAAASSIVRCAWAGIVPCINLNQSWTPGLNLFLGYNLGTYYDLSTTYSNHAREVCPGLCGENGTDYTAKCLLWGVPAYDKMA